MRKQFDFKTILSIENLHVGNIDKDFIKKCLAVIEKNIDDSTLSVDKLAEEMAFSSRNFYRKIKSLTNHTPAELIRVYRMHYVRQLLQSTNLKIFEIALAVGYDNSVYFSQTFKKQFGKLPSEYINKN